MYKAVISAYAENPGMSALGAWRRDQYYYKHNFFKIYKNNFFKYKNITFLNIQT